MLGTKGGDFREREREATKWLIHIHTQEGDDSEIGGRGSGTGEWKESRGIERG